ncbi:DUF1848 domain-containing protein [Succinatimonas hippei]|uniref:DUF1848 domain-containing protein n=1 Tax=Succinatimonas hippei TaxID=626938 RepID=UPI0024922E46|nr:DUF1848 domain-containing protein [Succinatimonas hippei]
MAVWEYEQITVNGEVVEAQAPIIVSASRSTDIPAFYAEWFFDRLEKGYSAWINPFNGVRSYISYSKTRFIVFWSKNPRPLIPFLPILKRRGIKCYLQFTLNDYPGLERVPVVEQRIETFKEFSQKLGKQAVIWRFDPLMLTKDISIDDLLLKIQRIGNKISKFTEKLVFSYADISQYQKVQHNLQAAGIPYLEWTPELMTEFAERLSNLNREQGWGLQLATCAEEVDLSAYGIEHNRCIDSDLIVKLAWKDSELMRFLKVKIEEPSLFSLFDDIPGAIALPDGRYFISVHKKDSGQRKMCGCCAAKDIGEYNTCMHQCEYCYANTSKSLAISNWKRHLECKDAPTITGR